MKKATGAGTDLGMNSRGRNRWKQALRCLLASVLGEQKRWPLPLFSVPSLPFSFLPPFFFFPYPILFLGGSDLF